MGKTFAAAFTLALFVSGLCLGQDYRARLQGTVVDASEAMVAGATVVLTNVDTGVTTVQQSNERGHYLFDLVEPGTYRLSVTAQGFSKFLADHVVLQTRSDLTVDASLKTGNLQETVTVTAEAAAVQFNTSKIETTIDDKLTGSMPQVNRSPFLLAQLDPSVVPSVGNGDWNPFNSWGPGSQSIGGGADYSSDLQVDGSPTGVGVKNSFQPTPDSVEEVNIQQSSVDAEFGHSAGSAITMITKSGTNQFHGLAFYQGQYPWANAVEDRINQSVNLDRKNIYGGTFGNPILKNKLFNFASYEGWKYLSPGSLLETLPTSLERQGNYSQSLNNDGGLRVIYDPLTTLTDSQGNVTRTPFMGNIIPASRIDPIAAKYTSQLWAANEPGIGPYHINNYVNVVGVTYPYQNFSDRADYNVNEKLRIYGRTSVIRTPATTSNPTGSPLFQNDRGSRRNATQIVGNATYTINPTTVFNVRADYHGFVDASNFQIPSGSPTFATIWPNLNFYQQLYSDSAIPKLIPRMSILDTTGSNLNLVMGPSGGYWQQLPNQDAIAGQISQQRNNHYLKAGFETRDSRVLSVISDQNPGFGFDPSVTSSTYVNPYSGPTNRSGDGYATFLLGAIAPTNAGSPSCWACGSTDMPINVVPTTRDIYYAGFLNDDWKVSRRLTLNLGVRYEYTTPYYDNKNELTAPLNLNTPIPQFQGANAPQMPALVQKYYTGSWILNGAYQFANGKTPAWNGGWGSFSPRVGFAYRLTDKTSVRAGYARYYTPWDANQTYEIESPNDYGFSTVTGAPNAIAGVPQMFLSNPFPSTNPITAATGSSLGANTGLGDSVSFANPNRPLQHSDRYNFSFQRELPAGIVIDATYFINFTNQLCGNNCFTNANLDLSDPRLSYQYGNALNQFVANPFYNIGTVSTFPGPLRYQPQVTIGSLMVPYPQYTGITELDGNNGANMHYQSLQLKLQRRFSRGYSFLLGYNYHREQDQVYYDSLAQYLNHWTWVDGGTPRSRLTLSGNWELPFGKGRQFMSGAPRAVDALVGGWNLTGLLTYQSGAPIKFTGVQVTGNPGSNVTPGAYFNTSVVQLLPGFTEETNPWYYAGVNGPHFFNIDASLVKDFHITERVKFSLRMDAFNSLNNVNLNAPNMSVGSATFGKSTDVLNNTFGRQLQLGLRLAF
jgi:hypothetical protein